MVHLGQRLRDRGNGSFGLFALFALTAPAAAAGCKKLFVNGGVNFDDLSAIKGVFIVGGGQAKSERSVK